MDFRIVWTDSATTDLEQIVRYIARDDSSAAKRLGEGIIGSVNQIGGFPNSGRVVPEECDENLREVLYSPYRIVYEIDQAEKTILVVRVWHAARGSPEIE